MARTQTDRDDDDRQGKPGMPVDLYRVYRTLWRGRWVLVGALVAGVAGGLAVAKYGVQTTYAAEASLTFTAETMDDRNVQHQELASFIEALSAPAVQTAFKEEMGLPSHLDVTKWFASTIDVYGGVAEIEGEGLSPAEAANNVNTIVKAALEYLDSLSRQGIEHRLETVEDRLKAARTSLETVRARYDAFRREKGITNLTSEQEQVIGAAATARAAADVAEADRAALADELAALQARLGGGGGGEAAVVAPSPDLRRMRGELQALRASGLAPEHPQVQALEARIRAAEAASGGARGALQREIGRVQAELAKATEEAERLQRAAEVTRARAAAASQVEGEASALLAAVRVEEQLVSDVETERAQLRDQLNRRQSNFRVISPAVPPTNPTSNKMKVLSVVGIPLLGLLLGLIGLGVRELWGLKVKTAAEVGFWGGGPVVGATTWPRESHAIDNLVADLDDHLPQASGSMLVVAATEREVPLVEELSTLMNEDWFSPALVDLEPPVTSSSMVQFEPVQRYAPALAAGDGGGRGGAALALRSAPPSGHSQLGSVSPSGAPFAAPAKPTSSTEAWTEPPRGQALRRAARLADRVLVVVAAGQTSVADVAATPTRLGRKEGVGYLLVGVEPDYAGLPDRIGDVEAFFSAARA